MNDVAEYLLLFPTRLFFNRAMAQRKTLSTQRREN